MRGAAVGGRAEETGSQIRPTHDLLSVPESRDYSRRNNIAVPVLKEAFPAMEARQPDQLSVISEGLENSRAGPAVASRRLTCPGISHLLNADTGKSSPDPSPSPSFRTAKHTRGL